MSPAMANTSLFILLNHLFCYYRINHLFMFYTVLSILFVIVFYRVYRLLSDEGTRLVGLVLECPCWPLFL